MSDNRAYLTDFFINKGLTPYQAAGIVGNLEGESSLDPRAVGDNGTSGGLAQWHNDRLQGLNKFAFNNNADANAVDTQAEYLWKELNTTHKTALNALLNSRDVNEATVAFTDHFEKPKNPNYDDRVGFAQKALDYFIPKAHSDEGGNVIYADTVEEAEKAKNENPNAQIFIKESAYDVVTRNIEEAKPETNTIEALAYGAGDLASGAFLDEALGRGMAAFDIATDPKKSFDKDWERLKNIGVDTVRERSDKAWNEHPIAYGTGAVVGAVGSPLNKIVAPLGAAKGGAAFGALYGAGSSDKELTDPATLADAAVGTVGGAVLGKTVPMIGKGLSTASENTKKLVGRAASNIKNNPVQNYSNITNELKTEFVNSFKPALKPDTYFTQLTKSINKAKLQYGNELKIPANNLSGTVKELHNSGDLSFLPNVDRKSLSLFRNAENVEVTPDKLIKMYRDVNKYIGYFSNKNTLTPRDQRSLAVYKNLRDSVKGDLDKASEILTRRAGAPNDPLRPTPLQRLSRDFNAANKAFSKQMKSEKLNELINTKAINHETGVITKQKAISVLNNELFKNKNKYTPEELLRIQDMMTKIRNINDVEVLTKDHLIKLGGGSAALLLLGKLFGG